MKKGIKISIGIAVLAVSVAVCAKMIQINQKYPQVQKETVSFGENAEMKNGIYMKVVDSKFLSEKEAQEAYGDGVSEEMEEGYEYCVVEIKVELENRTEEEQMVSLYDIYIENNTYCNGLAPEIIYNLENNQEMEITLPSKEVRQETLGYVLYKMQFTEKQWKEMGKATIYLVNERYPVKKRWECSAS